MQKQPHYTKFLLKNHWSCRYDSFIVPVL
jgi:hypothetical protein